MPEILIAVAETMTSPAGIDDYRQHFLFILDTLLTFLAEETELDLLIPGSPNTLNLFGEKYSGHQRSDCSCPSGS